MPLHGTKVIPSGWSAHHQPTVALAMTAVVDITRPGTGKPNRDEDTGEIIPPARTDVAVDEPARIQPMPTAERVVEVAGKLVTLRGYLVQVRVEVGEVKVGDTVTVRQALGDPQLAGRVLRVRDVPYASESWSRDLVCEDDDG